MRNFEVIVPYRSLTQPRPAIYPGGDCGPCCLAGILNKSVQWIYDRIIEQVAPLSWPGMRNLLSLLETAGSFDRFIRAIPLWAGEWWPGHGHFGFPGWQQNLAWQSYMLMAFDAGYCGITSVSYDKAGPPHEGDHWVLLCGYRRRLEVGKIPGATSIFSDVLVSCSSRHPDGKWVEVCEFLKDWGGYNVLLVKVKGEDDA